jgi:hypothetical protein
MTCPEYVPSNLECPRKKVVGESDERKPHVWFEVAGDGNQGLLPRRHPQTLPADPKDQGFG